ncbi:hypothetical protein A2J03_02490 [Rhodococcus sp. EPR-157]|nr:hypothetical protein A2J03_02490 [Rhodococcus sp. EPR-157]
MRAQIGLVEVSEAWTPTFVWEGSRALGDGIDRSTVRTSGRDFRLRLLLNHASTLYPIRGVPIVSISPG